MRRILPATLLFWFVFVVFPGCIHAITISSSGAPASIDQNSEFEASVALSCKGCDVSYLRGVFYPSGISYFGFTQNKNGDWINASGGNCNQYYQILQSDLSTEGTWSGKLKVKPDISSSLYLGPGDYLFKVGRYSASCGTALWSQEVTVAISGPSPTPVPTVTPIPTHTQAPTYTPTSAPTHTPTIKPNPTVTNSVTPTKKSTPTPIIDDAEEYEIVISETPVVLGDTNEIPFASSSGVPFRTKTIIISLAFIGSGLAVLTTAAAYKVVSTKNQTI
jgi:hypothetical protein